MLKGSRSTRLLVSLIDASECGAVRACPPDIIDLKNPAEGSLGMPDVDTISRTRNLIPGGLPFSVAIGDAVDDSELYIRRAKRAVEAGADIVKVGLFSFADGREEAAFLSRLRRGLSVPLVAAWYADRLKRPLCELPEIAAGAGAQGCLIDTYRKDGGRLTDFVTLPDLKSFIERCKELGLFSAVAGGLKEDDTHWISLLRPDVAGFRGAVANGKRNEPGLDRERLFRLRNAFTAHHSLRERGVKVGAI
jgi:uncharacterized protein (UPF0264 family)